jgi:hypothetical protein
MHFPQWVDLKGQDSVPDTVHHVVVPVDPKADRRWMRLQEHVTVGNIIFKFNIFFCYRQMEFICQTIFDRVVMHLKHCLKR